MAAAILGPAPAVHAIELLQNGNFESGTFTSWSTFVQSGSKGQFYIDAPGTTTPGSDPYPTSANATGGSFYAVSVPVDGTGPGPGAHALYQSFAIPGPATSVRLRFQMFVNDYFFLGSARGDDGQAGLDYTVQGVNQHARVDLLRAGSPDPLTISTGTGGYVVQNFYLGVDSNSNPGAWISYDLNLTSLVTTGQTYTVRFAAVSNTQSIALGIDNVSIDYVGSAIIPEAGSSPMLASGLALMGMTGMVKLCRRRK